MKPIPTSGETTAVARLLQLASSTLPVGGFAFSRGLESAVELGWVSGPEDVHIWTRELLDGPGAHIDLPILLRCFDAVERQDEASEETWARLHLAMRETFELKHESDTMARALVRLMRDLDLALPSSPWLAQNGTFVWAFARAGHALGLSPSAVATGYLYSTTEALVAAAIKAVPIGQTDGQRILLALSSEFESFLARAASLDDDEIGAISPALAIASSLHEHQRTRLFQS